MKVAVFGLGYVGCVSAAALAHDGHDVIGVDVNAEKVAAVNDARSPIVEPGLEPLIQRGREAGRLRATTDTGEAVAASDVSLLCVGTPSRKNGSLDLQYLARVSEEIGCELRGASSYHLVVVRSTVLPGTTHEVVIPALERRSGKRYGEGFGVAVNPEFLREGSALRDFRNPPLTLVGHNHAADAAGATALYEHVQAPVVNTSIRVAEMMKYASNTWHALKVSFANEIGTACKRFGVDSHEVMDIFCQDTKLNISPYYMKPGFAFGGSCLPKDVRALQYRAREADLDLPVVQSILQSNTVHVQRAVDEIVETGRKRVGLLGLAFKAGTDDLRESPMVILAESLLGKGFQVRIYDRNVSLARLVGANRQYIEEQIPHLSVLLRPSVQEVIDEAEVVVVGNAGEEFGEAMLRCRADQVVLDLVRLPVDHSKMAAEYRGICW